MELILVGFSVLALFVIAKIILKQEHNKKLQKHHENLIGRVTARKEKKASLREKKNKNIDVSKSTLLPDNIPPEFKRMFSNGEYDMARIYLQKIAYTMVGDDVPQEDKDSFKELMTYFADNDPLYHKLIRQLYAIIERDEGYTQSKIYVHLPEYEAETIRYVLYFAHELGDIHRVKKGRSYLLFTSKDKFSKESNNKSSIDHNNIPIKGYIGYYNLAQWWLNEFSNEERDYILKKYILENDENELTEIEVYEASPTIVSFLANMYRDFSDDTERTIQQKISKKIYESFDSNDNGMILDMHFFYKKKIEFAQFDKQNSEYYENLISSCNEQIEFAEKAAKAFKKKYKNNSLPSHTGYNRLVITLEKEKRYDDVIKICNQALSQKWAGDWEHRINRCQRKLERQK